MSNWVILQGDLINMDLVQFIRKGDVDEIRFIFREDEHHLDVHEIYTKDEAARDELFIKIQCFLKVDAIELDCLG